MISAATLLTLAATSVTQSDRPLGERMLVGLEVTLIGLITVFVVLSVLWGILELFRRIFSEEKSKKSDADKASDSAATASDGSDAALVAAITAAIASHTGGDASKLRVVRFTRR